MFSRNFENTLLFLLAFSCHVQAMVKLCVIICVTCLMNIPCTLSAIDIFIHQPQTTSFADDIVCSQFLKNQGVDWKIFEEMFILTI
jgi:hypothetical protein